MIATRDATTFFYCDSPTKKTKTAGGITKMPTSQSATARLITNRLVTVLRRRVVMTDKITKVLPIIVMIINKQKSTISTIFVHGQLSASALFWSVVFMFNHPVFREKEASKAHYTLREYSPRAHPHYYSRLAFVWKFATFAVDRRRSRSQAQIS